MSRYASSWLISSGFIDPCDPCSRRQIVLSHVTRSTLASYVYSPRCPRTCKGHILRENQPRPVRAGLERTGRLEIHHESHFRPMTV